MTFNVVSCSGVWMPKVDEPITIIRLTGTRNHSFFAGFIRAFHSRQTDNLVRAEMNNCDFETVDMAELRAKL